MKTIREQHIMSERNGHTVRIKTSELTGRALRYAVGKAVGHTSWSRNLPTKLYKHNGKDVFPADMRYAPWEPDRDWSQLGPLVERFEVQLVPVTDGWSANCMRQAVSNKGGDGETARIAACRAIAASHWGEYADIPEGLVDASDDASVQTSTLVEGE